MILSAGFGTRLKHLTHNIPKALVTYRGKPMIEYQIERLINCGVKEIIVNAHYKAEKLKEYFLDKEFDAKIIIVEEKEILGTGGGILNAEKYLSGCGYFPVVNVDIDTNFDLAEIVSAYTEDKPMAMLGIQKRSTSRRLEFSESLNLRGKENPDSSESGLWAFNGIHIISDKIFEQGYEVKFSGILEIYFDLVKKGQSVKGYDMKTSTFKDLGKPEALAS